MVLAACTCPGESHPGPVKANGDYVGRSAPEIDIIEATVTEGVGEVSLSCQLAPFNAAYTLTEVPGAYEIYDPDITVLNSYKGGVFEASAEPDQVI
jgi:beta-glucan synthesis-associated protein KRE6